MSQSTEIKFDSPQLNLVYSELSHKLAELLGITEINIEHVFSDSDVFDKMDQLNGLIPDRIWNVIHAEISYLDELYSDEMENIFAKLTVTRRD